MAGNCIAKLQGEQALLRGRLETLSKLDEYREFRDLDWRPLAVTVARLEAEKQELEATSDLLETLGVRLQAIEAQLAATEGQLDTLKDKRSRTEEKLSAAEALRRQTQALLAAADAVRYADYVEQLAGLRAESLGEHQLTIESCDNREQEMRQWLQTRIDAEDKKLERLREKIVKAMQSYTMEFPLDTQEVDVSVESAAEYRAMLDTLQADDLPRFEARFKELLNENTIREVANFQSQLARERETIKERIDHINASLTQIDYNPNRYIALEAQLTQDADIRDFQSELRACTEGTLTGSDDTQYSEAKFLQVKRIIERFRGREGQSEQDRRWTFKVTDVRNWFGFAARRTMARRPHASTNIIRIREVNRADRRKSSRTPYWRPASPINSVWNGAQYARAPFRFVVIDEAFGRGSDESAEYALQLFRQLNLQILIVTPLQKIHIIEPFVASVGFVHNEDGRASKLRNLTIEEYRAEKARSSS